LSLEFNQQFQSKENRSQSEIKPLYVRFVIDNKLDSTNESFCLSFLSGMTAKRYYRESYTLENIFFVFKHKRT